MSNRSKNHQAHQAHHQAHVQQQYQAQIQDIAKTIAELQEQATIIALSINQAVHQMLHIQQLVSATQQYEEPLRTADHTHYNTHHEDLHQAFPSINLNDHMMGSKRKMKKLKTKKSIRKARK